MELFLRFVIDGFFVGWLKCLIGFGFTRGFMLVWFKRVCGLDLLWVKYYFSWGIFVALES